MHGKLVLLLALAGVCSAQLRISSDSGEFVRRTFNSRGGSINIVGRPQTNRAISVIGGSTSSNIITNEFTGVQSRPAPDVSTYYFDQPEWTDIVEVAPGQYVANDARYRFGYSVNDDLTGDQKSVEESFDNREGVKRGRYTIHDPNGDIRTNTWIADDNGYRVHVETLHPDGTTTVLGVPIQAQNEEVAQPTPVAASSIRLVSRQVPAARGRFYYRSSEK